MIFQEGQWSGTGSCFSDEDKLLVPVECNFDIRKHGEKYEIVGVWFKDNVELHKHGFILKGMDAKGVCDLSLIYDSNMFNGALSLRHEPFIGTLSTYDKTISIGMSIEEAGNGYIFRGFVRKDEHYYHWNITLYKKRMVERENPKRNRGHISLMPDVA